MEPASITKEQAIAAFGGNAAALARALGITPSAVYQWDEGPIAEGYALKLRFVLKPDVFTDIQPDPRTMAAEHQSCPAAEPTDRPHLSEAA